MHFWSIFYQQSGRFVHKEWLIFKFRQVLLLCMHKNEFFFGEQENPIDLQNQTQKISKIKKTVFLIKSGNGTSFYQKIVLLKLTGSFKELLTLIV